MKYFFNITVILILLNSLFLAKNYKGAEYRTKDSFKYGRFEVNMKSADKDGMLASFFTYADGGGDWNEIDIEILGRYSNNVQFNPITPGQVNHVRSHYVNFNPALAFHTYAFEWTPAYVAWFIDGEEVHRQTGPHIESLTRSQKIMMNIWNPAYDNWVGDWNDALLPVFAYYDWVSYYSYSPGSGSYGTENNFTLQWKDDFNSWDTNRWAKATHTWDGNNCDFVYDNAVFRDGKLILCLTKPENLGYTDVIPPTPIQAKVVNGKVKALFSEALDKSTAEDISKYLIAGATIDSVRLLENPREILLSVTGLNTSTTSNLIVRSGIKDLAEPANESPNRAIIIHITPQVIFPVKINVGSSSSSGYLADQEWSPSASYGYLDGSQGQFSSPVSGTEEDGIYQSERNGMVVYFIRVPNGKYNLKLMMLEGYFSETNKRVFDIYVEGIRVADNLDIFKMAGKNTAYDIVTPVQVNDEELEIYFSAEIDKATLSGIVVEQISTGVEGNINSPIKFQLDQNYPNPFNGMTKINFFLPAANEVRFRIYDILGKQIYKNDLGILSSGLNEISWNGKDDSGIPASSGIYFYSIQIDNRILTKKLILLN